jgi:hypothetical protein
MDESYIWSILINLSSEISRTTVPAMSFVYSLGVKNVTVTVESPQIVIAVTTQQPKYQYGRQ